MQEQPSRGWPYAGESRAYTGGWLPLEGYIWLQMWLSQVDQDRPASPRSGPHLRTKMAIGRLTQEVRWIEGFQEYI